MKRLMMIGFGAMGQAVYSHLPEGLEISWVVVPRGSIEKVRKLLPPTVDIISDIAACRQHPDLVIEVAGQAAVREHAVSVLERGWNLALISVGALADDELYGRLKQTAADHDCHVTALAGAVAGIDGLAAAKELGLQKVVYQGRKHPRSWQGSHAEQLIDLNNVETAQPFFSGSAREAAKLFPANANVAATIALAGLGLDETGVELIVDPDISRNRHTVLAEGAFGEMRIELTGVPLPDNPKTSTLAALSVIRACRNLVSAVQI